MASRLLLLLILSTSLAYAVTPRPALMSRVASAPARSAMAPLMAGGAAQPAGSMAPTTAVVNLAKNIVGSGVLALAAGVAAYSGAGIAVLPALGIMLALCGLSCYSFSVIGRVGADAGAGTYKETWASVFGTSTSALPAAIVTFKTLVGAVAYAIIIGDSFGSINRLAGCARNCRRANFVKRILFSRDNFCCKSITTTTPTDFFRSAHSVRGSGRCECFNLRFWIAYGPIGTR